MSWRAIVLSLTAAGIGLGYGVPLAFFPIRWSRWFGWTAPNELALTRYFGRSLGVSVLTLAGLALWCALHPALERFGLGIACLGLAMAASPHFVGMVEKSQPRIETIEGFVFLALSGVFAYLLML